MIWRPLSLMLGLATLGAVWLGPLPGLADRLFVGHMLMHMLVVAVAAPLLAIGLAGGRLDVSERIPLLFSPILASVIELFQLAKASQTPFAQSPAAVVELSVVPPELEPPPQPAERIAAASTTMTMSPRMGRSYPSRAM